MARRSAPPPQRGDAIGADMWLRVAAAVEELDGQRNGASPYGRRQGGGRLSPERPV